MIFLRLLLVLSIVFVPYFIGKPALLRFDKVFKGEDNKFIFWLFGVLVIMALSIALGFAWMIISFIIWGA